MLKAYAYIFETAAANIENYANWFDPADHAFLVSATLSELRPYCHELGLVSTTARIDAFLYGLEFDKATKSTGTTHAAEMRRRDLIEIGRCLQNELRGQRFLYVSSVLASYYETPEIFGQDVSARFPKAIFDIEEAGKCLALGRSTASVFHCMRVLEVGLKAVSHTLSIPVQADWGAYIREINETIRRKPTIKAIVWTRDERFYQEIAGDLQSIKIAWRNPGIHIERTYNQEEATQIFEACRILMKRLAERLPGRRPFK